jgi:hypothetical protein
MILESGRENVTRHMQRLSGEMGAMKLRSQRGDRGPHSHLPHPFALCSRDTGLQHENPD